MCIAQSLCVLSNTIAVIDCLASASPFHNSSCKRSLLASETSRICKLMRRNQTLPIASSNYNFIRLDVNFPTGETHFCLMGHLYRGVNFQSNWQNLYPHEQKWNFYGCNEGSKVRESFVKENRTNLRQFSKGSLRGLGVRLCQCEHLHAYALSWQLTLAHDTALLFYARNSFAIVMRRIGKLEYYLVLYSALLHAAHQTTVHNYHSLQSHRAKQVQNMFFLSVPSSATVKEGLWKVQESFVKKIEGFVSLINASLQP